jgi:hypothetical protein
MQTFLPYPDFVQSASVLDYRRLGKQRVECKQILLALQRTSGGWVNHPAVRMWRTYDIALCVYGWMMCREWVDRGYKDNLMGWFQRYRADHGLRRYVHPPWLGDNAFHLSHQSNLVRKDAEFYGPLFPGVPDDLPYVWPAS